jgi:low temperature requirement protein LtrA
VNGFSVGLAVTGPLLLIGGFLEPGFRLLVWAVAGAIDLSLPFILRRRMASSQFQSGHLLERFGLFVIIALGESIVAIGSPVAGGQLVNSELVTVALAFILACGLWWVYFAFAAGAMLHAVDNASNQSEVVREVLSYGHLLLIASIISLAVGLAEAVAHPTEALGLDIASLLFGGCALYLTTFGYTRWRMFRRVSTTRLGSAGLLILLLPFSTQVPAMVSVGTIAAVLIGLNLEEHRRAKAGTA